MALCTALLQSNVCSLLCDTASLMWCKEFSYLAALSSFVATPILRQLAATQRRLIPNMAGWGSVLRNNDTQ